MKAGATLIVAMILAAGPVVAQTQPPAAGTQQKPAVQDHPATSVHPAQRSAATQSPAPEEVNPAKDAAVRHLLDITDQTTIGEHISGAISLQVRSIMGRNLPEDRLQKFMLDFDLKLHSKVSSRQVLDAVVPVYAQYLSLEDIQGLIQFYESPLGQRIVKIMPLVVQDSQEAGAKIEQEAALTVLREMSSEYPELKPLLPGEPTPSAAPAPAPVPTPSPSPNPDAPKD